MKFFAGQKCMGDLVTYLNKDNNYKQKENFNSLNLALFCTMSRPVELFQASW